MIRITRQADYAVMMLTHMAGRRETETFSARDLAQGLELPLPTASKILKLLARQGLLNSHRGVKGGYALGRGARDISVAEIVTAVDGPIAITECIEEAPGTCDQETHCAVRGNWHRINDAIRVALEGISLEEMTHEDHAFQPADRTCGSLSCGCHPALGFVTPLRVEKVTVPNGGHPVLDESDR